MRCTAFSIPRILRQTFCQRAWRQLNPEAVKNDFDLKGFNCKFADVSPVSGCKLR